MYMHNLGSKRDMKKKQRDGDAESGDVDSGDVVVS